MRRHFWLKPFCDLILTAILVFKQVSVIKDLKGTKNAEILPVIRLREVTIAKIIHQL